MNMPANRFLRHVATIVGVVTVVVVIWAGLRLIPASRGYSVRAEFGTLPANDQELEQWLRNQPGVVGDTVSVVRDGQAVDIFWIMKQNVAGNPPTPALRPAWERMGYFNQISVDWDWRDK